jgi:hypothetical protein
MGEDQTVVMPVEQTPRAVAGLAVFVTVVLKYGDDLEIDGEAAVRFMCRACTLRLFKLA